MSAITSVRSPRVSAGRRRVAVAQLTVIAVGLIVVVLLAGHGHDARALVGRAGLHDTIETGLMTGAMMLPVSALTVPLVMQRSLPDRRLLAAGEHAIGFGFVWFGFGVAAAVVFGSVVTDDSLDIWFVLVAVVALVWQLSRRRTFLARRCGRLRSAPPRGLRSHVGVTIAGAEQARWCVRTCALSMAAMVVAPHPGVMGLLWAANLSEWVPGPNPFGRARRVRPALALGAAAAAVACAPVIAVLFR